MKAESRVAKNGGFLRQEVVIWYHTTTVDSAIARPHEANILFPLVEGLCADQEGVPLCPGCLLVRARPPCARGEKRPSSCTSGCARGGCRVCRGCARGSLEFL